MSILINSLLPVFLLISLGYFLKKIHFANEEFWRSIDRLTYYILFPSLLIYKLSNAQLSNIDGISIAIMMALIIIAISIILIILNKYFKIENSAFTSVYQGAIRFNTYVFLALIDSLLGEKGLIIAAFIIGILIPLINLLCITIFTLYVPNGKITLTSFINAIIKNPLIIACFIGASINYIDITLPLLIQNTLSILSMAALPIGLLSIGFGLHLSHILIAKNEILIASVFKLIILPLFIFTIGKIIALDSLTLAVLVIFGAMPTASSGYVLAKQLGGDFKLLSSIISIQTIVSIITIMLISQLLHF